MGAGSRKNCVQDYLCTGTGTVMYSKCRFNERCSYNEVQVPETIKHMQTLGVRYIDRQ